MPDSPLHRSTELTSKSGGASPLYMGREGGRLVTEVGVSLKRGIRNKEQETINELTPCTCRGESEKRTKLWKEYQHQ